MILLFGCDPLDPSAPDPAFAEEVQAAKDAGWTYYLLDMEALETKSPRRLVRQVPRHERPEMAIYRGWMLRFGEYQNLALSLFEPNVPLINRPWSYRTCHEMPFYLPDIQEHTPRTIWGRPHERRQSVLDRLSVFGDKPIIVRDYVKSRKHEWYTACFIPDASDREVVEATAQRFQDLQGTDFTGNLVFREYVELESAGVHPFSKMPLSVEWRVFYLNRKPIFQAPYWGPGTVTGDPPVLDNFQQALNRVASDFFTVDYARRKDGTWIILELGDGQVSSIPDGTDKRAFYEALRKEM